MVKRNRVQVDPDRGDRQSFVKAAASLRVASFESLLRDGNTVSGIEREYGYSRDDYQDDLDISGATSNIAKHLAGEHDQKTHAPDKKASGDNAPSGGSLWTPGGHGKEGGSLVIARDPRFFFALESDIDDSGGVANTIKNAVDQLRWWNRNDEFKDLDDGTVSARERGYLIDPDGKVNVSLIGTYNLVPMGRSGGIFDGWSFIHNHPANTSLSGADVTGARGMQLDRIEAVTDDGVARLRLGPKFLEAPIDSVRRNMKQAMEESIQRLQRADKHHNFPVIGSHMTNDIASRSYFDGDYNYEVEGNEGWYTLDKNGKQES